MRDASKFSVELSLLARATLRGNENLVFFEDESRLPDEERIIKLARWHQVQSLLHDYLSENELFITESYFEQLKSHGIQEAVYNMIFLRKSLDLNRDLNAGGVQAFLMKGALWAWLLYEKPALREFGDIDFFLQKTDIPKGLAVFKGHGFHPDSYRKFLLDDEKVRELYFETDYQLPLEPEFTEIVKSIEIQWNSTYPRFAYSFSWDELMSRTMLFEVLDEKIVIPSIDNQLLMMIVHHAGVEQWDKLKFMGDFVRLLRKFSKEIDWQYVTKITKQKGFNRLFKESLGMVRVLTGEDYSSFMGEGSLSHYPTEKFKSTVFSHWENLRPRPVTKSWQIFYFNMIYRDRPGDKLSILFKHLAYLLEWKLLIPKAVWYYKNRR